MLILKIIEISKQSVKNLIENVKKDFRWAGWKKYRKKAIDTNLSMKTTNDDRKEIKW